VRLHPKNRPEEFAVYAGEIDAFSAGGDPVDVLLDADLVVGMSSMILQEAAFLGRSVLAILPRAAERAWLPMLQSGAIPCVTDRAAIAPTVQRLLATRPQVDLTALDGPPLVDFVLSRLAVG
jgi:hypothetical protein